MCLLHNTIIRGFNSIYLQAPHVNAADKADFVGYAQVWYRFVKSHHDDEEATLFTAVEGVLDDKEIWAETHKEHGKFQTQNSQRRRGRSCLSSSLFFLFFFYWGRAH